MNPYKRFVARNSLGRIFRFGPYVDLVDNNDLGTVVDLADLPGLLDRAWAVVKSNGQFRVRAAAKRGEPGTAVYLARFLLAPPAGAEVDHINREPLDNRRCNLRIAGRHLNSLNRRWRNARPSGLPQGVHPVAGRHVRYLGRLFAGGRPWVSTLVDTIPQAEQLYRAMRQEYEAHLVAGRVPQDFIPSESARTGGQPRQRRVQSRQKVR